MSLCHVYLVSSKHGGGGMVQGESPCLPPLWPCSIPVPGVAFVVGPRPYSVGFSPVTVTFLIATELNCKYFANFSHSHF